MSDFFSVGWSIWIAAISILGIIFCLWLLFSQRKEVVEGEDPVKPMANKVWDGNIVELDNSAPRWCTVMYVGLCVFAFGFLLLCAGLVSFKGRLDWTAAQHGPEQQMEI